MLLLLQYLLKEQKKQMDKELEEQIKKNRGIAENSYFNLCNYIVKD